MDGVLVREHPLSPAIPEACALIANRAKIPTEEVLRLIRKERRRRVESGLYAEAFDYNAMVRKIASSLHVESPPPLELMMKKYSPSSFEDALPALGLLAQHTLVALTNGYACFQIPTLDSLGLTPFLKRIVTADAIGFGKPDPRAFAKALQGLDGYALSVGDSLFFDVYGSRAAGLASVWLYRRMDDELRPLNPEERVKLLRGVLSKRLADEAPWSTEQVVPDYVISDLRELVDLIDGLSTVHRTG